MADADIRIHYAMCELHVALVMKQDGATLEDARTIAYAENARGLKKRITKM